MRYLKNKKLFSLVLLFVTTIAFRNCKKSKTNLEESQQITDPDSTDNSDSLTPLSDTILTIPGAYFSDPARIKAIRSSAIIMDKLIECIDATPDNSVIYVNVYDFDYMPVALALQRAGARGVQLNIMIDSSKESSWKTNRGIVNYLRTIINGTSKLVLIHNDNGINAINHHKYVLFSELSLQGKRMKNVIFSTSSNFAINQLGVLQDAVILRNKDLYDAFVANWQVMKKHAISGMTDFDFRSFHSKDGLINAYFFPRRFDGSWDGKYSIPEILDKLDENGYAHDTIMIGMSRWSDGQIGIAEKLMDLKHKGVHIEIITRYEGGSGLGTNLTKKLKDLKAEGCDVLFLPKPYIIHSKYMLIKGRWEGEQHHIIINGSLNWTNPSTQHNNNLVMILKDSPLFDDYEKNFEKIKTVF